MTEVIATVQDASQAAREVAPVAEWNPVYRTLVDPAEVASSPHRAEPTPAEPFFGEKGLELVLRQLTTPALLVVAVTDGERTRRLRIGLDPTATTLERSDGDLPSRWSRLDVQDVPGEIAALLKETGIDSGPGRQDARRRGDALRLSPAQSRIAHDALRRGLSSAEAFESIPDLDDTLRDVLTATGLRLSLALTLHDPRERVTQEPVSWFCLWARGSRGLYRVDQPAGPALTVHPVGEGDVLGTLLPVLEQGLRFAAACAAEGDVR